MHSKTCAAPAAERYVVLDSWRGICAILVALFHFPLLWHFQSTSFVRGCWLFVDFFFVLSGFVIAHAYAGKLSTRKDLVAFVIRRFGRLWPLHFALLMFVLGAALIKFIARGMGADIEITSNSNNTRDPVSAFLRSARHCHLEYAKLEHQRRISDEPDVRDSFFAGPVGPHPCRSCRLLRSVRSICWCSRT